MAGHDSYTRLRYERKEVYLCDAFLEAECAWVEFKESEDILEGISFGVP